MKRRIDRAHCMCWQRVFPGVVRAGAAAVVLAVVATAVHACKTPVYRYAMYKWQRTPYEVFYLHQGKISEQHAAVNRQLQAIVDTQGKVTANLRFTSLDMSDDQALDKLPAEVRKQLKARAEKPLPAYFLFTPFGTQLHAGDLDTMSIETLVDSPARKKMNAALAGGAPLVLVMIDGKEAEANAAAEKAVAEVIARAAQGKYDPVDDALDDGFGLGPPAGEPAAADGEAKPIAQPVEKEKPASKSKKDDQPAAKGMKLVTVRITRDDAREDWFIRGLMQVERDLHEFTGQPMVFPVYGRGRVTPPYIGRGVTADNLGEAVVFAMGDCSCQVKEQNPGMDLLTRWNWEDAALTMAEKHGNETGNEQLLSEDDFFSLVVAPSTEIAPGVAAKQPAGTKDTAQPVNIEPDQPPATTNGNSAETPRETRTDPVLGDPVEVDAAGPQKTDLAAGKDPPADTPDTRGKNTASPPNNEQAPHVPTRGAGGQDGPAKTDKKLAKAPGEAGGGDAAQAADPGALGSLQLIGISIITVLAALVIAGFLFLRPRSA